MIGFLERGNLFFKNLRRGKAKVVFSATLRKRFINYLNMRIYKFRSLANETDYCRLKNILETGYFWCSKFFELNDPMEGVFSFYEDNKKIIEDGVEAIYSLKNKYKICSFSGVKGFENPILWGYYTNGFKGVAIEVEVREEDIMSVKYKDSVVDIFFNNSHVYTDEIKEILTRKLKPWEHEDEFRFLKESEYNNNHKIGEITAVYFGNPYGNLSNTGPIQGNEILTKFNEFKKRLIGVAKDKKIHCYSVRSKNTIEIVKDNEL